LGLKGLKISAYGINRFLTSKNVFNLRELRLAWNYNIDDSVLKKICIIPQLNLKKLYINNTSVTPEGVQEFLN
jgi:hypothetical protein